MNIIFGKKRSEKISQDQPEINKSFAQQVLDLEVEINFQCNIENIKRLMELYTKAIEFYESDTNDKFVYYQEKMKQLLSQKDVLEILSSESSPKKKIRQDSINIIDTKLNNISQFAKLPLERNCERVLQDHTIEASSISKKIGENLKGQSESLAQKIESRRNSRNMNKSNKNQSDKSAGEAKSIQVEEFELEVEKIMEKFVEEKSYAKKEIEKKYQEYIKEFEFMEGDIIKNLMQELNKNMENEIEEKIKEIEMNRTQAISLARKKLCNKF